MSRPLSSSSLFPYTTLFRSLDLMYLFQDGDGILVVLLHDPVLEIGNDIGTGVLKCEFLCFRVRSCPDQIRSEEHTSELQSRGHLVCRLLLEKKKHRPHINIS